MKLNEINPIKIYGTGFYEKNTRALYKRTFRGELTEEYFIKLFNELCKPHHKNIKELGSLNKVKFRVKYWKYKEVEVSRNKDGCVNIKLL